MPSQLDSARPDQAPVPVVVQSVSMPFDDVAWLTVKITAVQALIGLILFCIWRFVHFIG